MTMILKILPFIALCFLLSACGSKVVAPQDTSTHDDWSQKRAPSDTDSDADKTEGKLRPHFSPRLERN